VANHSLKDLVEAVPDSSEDSSVRREEDHFFFDGAGDSLKGCLLDRVDNSEEVN